MVGYFISCVVLSAEVGNYLNSVESQLESNLVISLSGATVRHGNTLVLLSNTHPAIVSTSYHLLKKENALSAGNNGTSQGCSEEVLIFKNSIALNCSKAKLFDEFLLQVFDDELDGANGDGFLFGGGEVFGLANVGLVDVSSIEFRTK